MGTSLGNSTEISVEKFPLLRVQGRRLIWDSRQPATDEPELVVVPSAHITPELRSQLLSRKNAMFIGDQGAGLDLEVKDARRRLGELSSESLGRPSSKLKVYGVTGTNGKTTCASLLRHLFVRAGRSVCEIGTLGVRVWRDQKCVLELETGFTTPEAPTLHHLLSQLVLSGITHVVMEISSHAVELGRIGGLDIDGLLFTNLSQDHLDFHQTMQAYEEAKTRLFTDYLVSSDSSKARRTAVVNTRDAAGARIFGKLPLHVRSVRYELGKTFGLDRSDLSGLTVHLEGDEFRSAMVGEFNAENLVGCLLLAERGDGVERSTSLRAAATFQGAPGRLERVASSDSRFVFVDYAHTPDALEKVLTTLGRVRKGSEKLIVVFGCGGDRDRGKRPLMGEIAARLADRVILTSDNPRSEDPRAILKEIEDGIPVPMKSKVTVVEDRRQAIENAIRSMAQGDVCVVAGKGHESYQIVKGVKSAFSDVEVCRALLASS